MSMLSLFPQFLDWSWYVPFVFRMLLALYTFSYGVTLLKKQKTEADSVSWSILGALVVILSLSYFFGVYIQLAGVIGFSFALLAVWLAKKNHTLVPESRMFYILIGFVSLSLLFLGPGPFAFDLPL